MGRSAFRWPTSETYSDGMALQHVFCTGDARAIRVGALYWDGSCTRQYEAVAVTPVRLAAGELSPVFHVWGISAG